MPILALNLVTRMKTFLHMLHAYRIKAMYVVPKKTEKPSFWRPCGMEGARKPS